MRFLFLDEMRETLDALGNPDAIARSIPAISDWFHARNRRVISQRLNALGYVKFCNPDNAQGLWRKMAVYVREPLATKERFRAIEILLTEAPRQPRDGPKE